MNPEDFIHILTIERFYEGEGELIYEIEGENTPLKWNSFSHEDFNLNPIRNEVM